MDEKQIEEMYPESYGIMAKEQMDEAWSYYLENYINHIYPLN